MQTRPDFSKMIRVQYELNCGAEFPLDPRLPRHHIRIFNYSWCMCRLSKAWEYIAE